MINTFGDISQRTAAHVVKEMLTTVQPIEVLAKFALTKPVPKNTADSVKFRRRVPFDVSTAPLVEGVTPQGQQIVFEDVSMQLYQYGGLAETTDVIEDQAEDPVLMEISKGLGEQAIATHEQILWNVIKGGTAVTYANGTSRTAVNTPVSVAKIRAVVRSLKAQKAAKFTSMLDASPKYGTRPVEACYVAVCHTDLENDIRNLPGFTPVVKYASGGALCPQEFGSLEEVRFITSPELTAFADGGGAKAGSGTTMVSTSGTSADVYPILILGKEAYATCPLRGADSMKPMVLKPGIPRGGDPLGQRGSVGWKAYLNAVVLNQSFMERLEVAATDL